jgi:putative ABC transport system permease protein
VKAFAAALIASAALATFAALAQALERRQTDLALLRAIGVPRGRIAALVLLEAVAVALAAFVVALTLVAAGAYWLSQFALPGLQIDVGYGALLSLAVVLATVTLALVASLPTLRRAFRIDVATQLSHR